MKTILTLGMAALACVTLSAGTAQAEQQKFPYTCKAGGLTITSKTPCYATTQGISVPGGGIDKDSKKGGDGGGKKGGGFNGPKDLKDKPKGGGFNGPNNIKDKD